MSLHEKLDGDEIDLSLNQLTEVPVKDLARLPKGTRLDISCNLLEKLPKDFTTLKHLVKIDLSKNKLKGLPLNFGDLVNLQYLDLYENQLQTLPVSFCKLKHLQWLDLKNNPLESALSKIAGDCLNHKECQACAKNVVGFYENVQKEINTQEEKKMKELKEKLAREKIKQDRELEIQRIEKKIMKEQRRRELQKKENAKQTQHKEERNVETISGETFRRDKTSRHSSDGFSMKTIFAVIGFLVLLCCVVIFFNFENINPIKDNLIVVSKKCLSKIQSFGSEAITLYVYYSPKFKMAFLKIVHSCMQSVSHYTSLLEDALSVYF